MCVCVCVSTSTLSCWRPAVFHFRDRYVGWAAVRGAVGVCVCVGGGAMDFFQILFV